MVGLSLMAFDLSGSAVQTGTQVHIHLVSVFPADSCGLLSACTNRQGAALKTWGVKLGQKWPSLNLRADGRPTWGWEWEKVGSWPSRPLLQGAPGLTLLRGDPSRWVSLPGFGSQGPFQRRHWWPGVGTPPQLKLRAPTLQDPQDGPSGAWVAEPAVFPDLSSGLPPSPLLGRLSFRAELGLSAQLIPSQD